MMSASRKAGHVWLVTVGVPLGWDLYAVPRGYETASGALVRGLKNPYTRWPILIFTLITLKHLYVPRFLPRLDPYQYAAKKIEKRVVYECKTLTIS